MFQIVGKQLIYFDITVFYIPLILSIFRICSFSLLSRLILYASQSFTGYFATPLSMAAFATAGAICDIRRGSRCLGMIYSLPNVSVSRL